MSEIQSLARGLKILDLLSQSQEGVGITEMAEVLEINKSSASRLVNTLVKYGYADKDEATRLFHLDHVWSPQPQHFDPSSIA